jgi:hypothetical protein
MGDVLIGAGERRYRVRTERREDSGSHFFRILNLSFLVGTEASCSSLLRSRKRSLSFRVLFIMMR